MKHNTKNIRLYLVIVLFSLLVGSIYIYPDIRFILDSGSEFNGFTLTATADEAFYLSRLNAVYNGDYALASGGLYEHRGDLWLVPPFTEVLLGSIGKSLNIPVQYLDIIFSFIFPVVIFWLIYLLVLNLSGSSRSGFIGAASVLFGYAFFSTKLEIIKAICLDFDFAQPLWFLRPFSPQLIYIPFILALFLIFKFVSSRSRWSLVLTAFAIVWLNYLHLFIWAFICAGLGVRLIIALFRKEKLISKNIIFIFIVSFILAIPYWFNHYQITQSPSYSFLQIIFGAESSHRMILPKIYILVTLLILYMSRKSRDNTFWYVLSFLLGGIVCLNQQVISGTIIEPVHWTNYTNKTFLIIGMVACLRYAVLPGSLLRKIPANSILTCKKVVSILLICFFVIIGIIQQNNYYHDKKKDFLELQTLSGAAHWLNNNTSKEDVVLTDSIRFPAFVFVRNLLLYTHNYYYLSVEAHSLISQDEKEHRLLSAMRFFDYTPKEAEEVIDFWKGLNFIGVSARYSITGDLDTIDLDAYVSDLKIKWDDFLRQAPVSLVAKYKVDYVLLGKNDHLFNTIENKYPAIKKVYEDNSYKIFQVKDVLING